MSYMSLEGRKICRSCEKLGIQYSVYDVEKAAYLYFSNDIIQVLKYIENKTFTFDYLQKVKIKQRKYLTYEEADVQSINWESYDIVMSAIDGDFSITTVKSLIDLLQYELPVIKSAIAIAKSKGIFSIPYILACCPYEQKKFHKKIIAHEKINAELNKIQDKVEVVIDVDSYKNSWDNFKNEEDFYAR